MRLLLTSDWQADSRNLDLCEIALQELLAAAERYKPDAIINLGDLKEQLSPVSVPVVKFWVKAVSRIKKSGFKFIILRGNHDRVSQTVDSEDWLSIFRSVETASKPKVIEVGDGLLFCLPFVRSKDKEREWAKELAHRNKIVAPLHRVLLFHTDLKGAQMSAAGTQATGNSGADLLIPEYTAAFGGHIHIHQNIGGNAWYVGSPFCQDWGESNISHGHVLADITSSGVKVQQLPTSIPGWYDKEFLDERRKHCEVCGGSGRVEK